jgi:Tol biopolymer transport system component
MRQLAYVGEDGQVRVTDLDARRETEITRRPGGSEEDHTVVCNWPTWSPDGDHLAFFQFELAGEEVQRTSVSVASIADASYTEIYALPGGAPIYMCWAPDGQRLAVLVQEARELYLRVVRLREPQQATTVAQGAPLYFAWHPDSRGLIVNTGGSGSTHARLIWVRIEGGQATYATLGGAPAADFRAPAWSTKLGAATMALSDGDGAEIAAQVEADGPRQRLVGAGPGPAFVWSRDGQRLAFASRAPEYGGAYGPISIYDAADGSAAEVTAGPAAAFFWCPDSVRLLYAAGDVGGRMVNLQLVDVISRAHVDLGWMRPSRDVMLLLGHFDQYSQSAQIFSPAGDELALAASIAQEQLNGSVPTVRQITVRSLNGGDAQEAPVRGRLAFWRPDPTA